MLQRMTRARREKLKQICISGTHVDALLVAECLTEIHRLREQLRWYADPLTHRVQQGDTMALIQIDKGRNARTALRD